MGLFMDIVDSSIVNSVLRELIRLFREEGDLSSRRVSIDVISLAEKLKVSLRDTISSLLVLELRGVISLGQFPRILDVEVAVGELLALLDWRLIKGLVDRAAYNEFLDLLSRKASSYGPGSIPALDAEPDTSLVGSESAFRILAVRVGELCSYVSRHVCSRVRVLHNSIDFALKSEVGFKGFVIELESLLSLIDNIRSTMLYKVFQSSCCEESSKYEWSSATINLLRTSTVRVKLMNELAEFLEKIHLVENYDSLSDIVGSMYDKCRGAYSSE